MGDQSNDRPSKRPRTRANASRSQAPSYSGLGADLTSGAAITGPIAPREEDVLVLYDAVPWPASYNFRQILQPAPFASPLGLSYTDWLNNTVGDPLGRSRELCVLITESFSELTDILTESFPMVGSDGQRFGFLCSAEWADEQNQKKLSCAWINRLGPASLPLDLRKEFDQSKDDWKQDLTFYGLQKKREHVKSGGTEYNYFVLNRFQQPFSINGVRIARGTVAGPLPHFAIIDIDGIFALWWGAPEGLDYVPQRTKEETKRSYDTFQELENLNDNDRPIRRARISEEVPATDDYLDTIHFPQNQDFDPTSLPPGENFVADQSWDESSLPPFPSVNENPLFDQLQSQNPGSQFPSADASFVLSQTHGDLVSSSFRSLDEIFNVDQLQSGISSPSVPLYAENLESQTDKEPTITNELTWCAEYESRLRDCSERRVRAVLHKFPSVGFLSFDDVIFAIGSMWRGCADKMSSWFAFGNVDLFNQARSRNIADTRCVQPGQPFIIPLLVNGDTAKLTAEPEFNKESPPHVSLTTEWQITGQLDDFKFPKIWDVVELGPKLTESDDIILVIAQLSDWKDVQLTFFDNCDRRQHKDVIRRAARNVVRNSAWLLDTWPNFTEEIWESLPPTLNSTSGLHTVLNAWAWMLNIRLDVDQSKFFPIEFYEHALTLVGLALGGQLDGWTIRAFLHCYGYAAPEDHATVVMQDILQDTENQKVLRARSHPMNAGLLNSILQGVYNTDEKPVGEVLFSVQSPPSDTQGRLRSHNTQPDLAGQPGLEDDPILDDQPILGAQPIPGNQSGLGGYPILDGQPILGSQSGLGDQPVLESQPDRQRPTRKQPTRKRKSQKQSGQEPQPSLEGQRRLGGQPDSEGQPVQTEQPKRKGRPGRKPKEPLTVHNWEARLNTGLEEARLRLNQTTALTANLLTKPNDLADEEVMLPIAAVWDGLRHFRWQYAYGTTDCFRFNRGPDTLNRDMTVVPQSFPLIMPLLFTDEYPTGRPRPRGHDHIGHLMLVVAEKVGEDPNQVNLIFIDSARHQHAAPAQRAVAENLVRHSGWMGVDSQGHPIPTNPTFTEDRRGSPAQEYGNTCGFYLIMNAWAYMLGIPVYGGAHRRNRSGQRSGKNFLATGIEIINLAMAGCMDFRTIQAFLNHYCYSVDQNIDDPWLFEGEEFRTRRVTVPALQEIVHDLRQVAMMQSVNPCQCPPVVQEPLEVEE